MTVIAVVLGGALLGIIGALIAIPVAAAVHLLVEEVTFHRMGTELRRELRRADDALSSHAL